MNPWSQVQFFHLVVVQDLVSQSRHLYLLTTTAFTLAVAHSYFCYYFCLWRIPLYSCKTANFFKVHIFSIIHKIMSRRRAHLCVCLPLCWKHMSFINTFFIYICIYVCISCTWSCFFSHSLFYFIFWRKTNTK